jgi:hypothetical protein
MSTVLPSETIRLLIRRAESVLERHVTAAADNRCLSCGALGTCRRQKAALVILNRYGRLPARHPGATRPDQVHATDRVRPTVNGSTALAR